eukprot:CAMPEP_0185728434 /NCGR_PEP_ID=MMETSP1171-20130828/3777_1 /TAXON_ID=374046 /ORGANISM="Helicotheca tamensis, Strain CCMP826" /LENGTH=233 /DNA_ID=CAMNT_0028397147 /DNA_START=51 /DNA_END=749 /DNA_ORIENTATION=+
MASALPISKLAGLLVKTLSKPLAKRIKHEFSRYPFTQNILVGIGQATHQLTSRMTIYSAGYKVRSINPLETEKAMAKGADFLGESIVFLVSGSTVVFEYNRSKEKERIKEEKKHKVMQEESDRLQAKLNALDTRLVALEEVLKARDRSILKFRKKYVEPNVDVVIDDRPNRGVAATANGGDEAEGDQMQTSNGANASQGSEPSYQSNEKSREGVEDPSQLNNNSKTKSQRWGW